MPNDKLDNLVKIGRLKAETATTDEVAGLIRSGLARLADAKIEKLSIESRFDLAYNAAHALALAALRAADTAPRIVISCFNASSTPWICRVNSGESWIRHTEKEI